MKDPQTKVFNETGFAENLPKAEVECERPHAGMHTEPESARGQQSCTVVQ